MRESRLAIRGMMTLGTGHALNVLLGLVMVTWVPRYFGVTDYGHWVWFRSLIGFLVGFGLLGAGDVMARFYMGYRSEGCPEDAGRVFKSVLVFRCVLAVALAAVGCGLVLASDSAFAHPRAGLLLSVSVVFQTLTVTFNLLLYGERRLGWQVALGVLQTVAVPLAILIAYRVDALQHVPLACVAGDFLCLVVAFLASRPWRAWPQGWLSRAQFRSVFIFGGLAAFYSLAMNAYTNLMPALMDLRGYDVRAIGFVGFALRLTLMMHLTLSAIGGGLYPSLAALAASDALERAIEWQHMCTRYGALVLLLGIGIFLIVGDALVPMIVGDSFAGASGMVAVALLSTVPQWISAQALRIALLVHRSRAFGLAGLALAAGFAATLFLSPVIPTGLPVAWAMCAGFLGTQIVAMWCVRDCGVRGLHSFGLAVCFGLLALPYAYRAGWRGSIGPVLAVILWLGLFAAMAVATNTLRGREFLSVWRMFKERRPSGVEAPPTPEASPGA